VPLGLAYPVGFSYLELEPAKMEIIATSFFSSFLRPSSEDKIILTRKKWQHMIQPKGKRVKESHNMPGVAQRVPGGLGSQISMTFGT
jgi:hypothetical protein